MLPPSGRVPVSQERVLLSSGRVPVTRENLVNIGPLFVAVHDDANFMTYKGGIYEPPACSTPASNAPPGTLVGWVSGGDAGPDYWIVRMPFGTSWGRSGYAYIHKGSGICAFSQAITFVGGP